MSRSDVAFYATPGAMTALPDDLALADLPTDLDELRAVVQGLVLHRDWAPAYGVTGDAVRVDEQNLRSTCDVLARALELSPAPITVAREPVDRVLGICRCGFGGYFEAGTWHDHWITERWDGDRWVRDDPQIDALQADVIKPDFDPHDQPPGRFLTGSEAWIAARAGEVDPERFGIFDMWGPAYIIGNVITDFASLNKVELLPWDHGGMMTNPFDPVAEDRAVVVDEIAALATSDDLPAIRARFGSDERLRVPAQITTFIDGQAIPVNLEL